MLSTPKRLWREWERWTLLLLLGVLVLSGCSDSSRFSFEGAEGAFCVPGAYVVKAPLWLSGDIAPDNAGFAFRGCGAGVVECTFPPELTVGTVGPLSDAPGRYWSDFGPGSHYRALVSHALQEHTYTAVPDTGREDMQVLAVPDSSAAVTFWRTAKDHGASLHPHDELLARCEGINGEGKGGGGAVAFGCSRILLNDAAISYDFTSGAITTAFVEDMDRRVIGAVEHWRCR